MASTEPRPVFSKPAVPIARPADWSYPRPTPPSGAPRQYAGQLHAPPPVASSSRPGEERIDINSPNVDPYDDRIMTQAETEKALRDFVADAYNDSNVEYTVEDAMVEGFREGIMLLPHQVKSRRWMAERESGKKAGGILADDMG